jgi:hypothetical protein
MGISAEGDFLNSVIPRNTNPKYAIERFCFYFRLFQVRSEDNKNEVFFFAPLSANRWFDE